MKKILLKNASILDLARGELIAGMNVLIDGRNILEVSGADLSSSAEEVVDLQGRTLMPGLIDCHVHVMASHVNLGHMANMPNAFALIRALPILKEMLHRGFTTVRDAGGADWALAQAADNALIESPRIFPAGKALSQTGGHGDFRARSDQLEPCACSFRIGNIARVVDGVDDVRRAARDELTKGATQIKIMASGGVTSPNDPIGNTGFSIDELKAIVDEATAWQTYVMAHAYTPRAIRRAIEAGVRTIEHGNLIDEETAHFVKDHGAFVVPTLITYDALSTEGPGLGLPPESIAKIDDVRLVGRQAISLLHRVGVKMGFGSDLLGESHVHQSEELKIRAGLVGTLDALQSATTVAAEILQREGALGVVKAGAIADLLIVDGNPLVDIDLLLGQGKFIPAIMKDGRFVKNQLSKNAS
ncbi:Imidazolonepropionase [Collimonas sp. OK307]|uniref:metal-dependent hydrolase family protein n=1 Tax=Collimonas sp. OK307 TaxID=1801620 RepID=UPI0008E48E1C|nr:amidohydrolase family protein [Collimonas sp. OK307]SFH72188.1 Imidazolonepropionase [Collimonas sp. OK307]